MEINPEDFKKPRSLTEKDMKKKSIMRVMRES